MPAPRIAYVSLEPSTDVHAWSGLNKGIADCLEGAGLSLDRITLGRDPRLTLLCKVSARLPALFGGGRRLWTRHPLLLRAHARRLQAHVDPAAYDFVFSPGSEPFLALPADYPLPFGFWTDAPMGAMVDYYAWYAGMAPSAKASAVAGDTRCLRRAALACYSSAWAVEAAVRVHGAPPERVHEVPFGPNLDSCVSEADLPALATERLSGELRLLFVGVDWIRKGAELAVALQQELCRRGRPAVLDIVGCLPPKDRGPLPEGVRLHGFVNKRSPEGAARLADFFRKASLFILPSQAEAFGVVFCEAAAHALPCLACRTGGIPSIIRDGETGLLLEPGASASTAADRLLPLLQPEPYARLSRAAWEAWRDRLNWKSAGRLIAASLR